ncbi:putative membrane protein (TIGR02234 family) [Arthrobacter sp. V4I6]|uniref:Trp biosynthesis-associated membrane protein n=1 Tax=unclassified Arthrobacter TaxID=235627 RepID=UPI0027835063|nr:MULTISPECIES: Trp biosynthesis-associated membrane protein [unclassified Arthrobacter]MDQ0821628.1 putative membrane protein (TIGR02234 family) [Arthrobacter sp. V1I7]MDQ0855893.1 putative membrane protein (TIGR02234 family) [Arthrobacter sp. V4I6]
MTRNTTVQSTSPAVPRWARKSTLVLVIAALALAVFGTTTQTWLTVHLDPTQLGQAVNSQDGLQVQGSKAATTVTALALVALAGGLAASIAGRIARWIITAIILLAAAGIVGAAAVVQADPLAAAQGSIAAATGISGSSVQVGVTALPALAVVAGSLLGLTALAIVPAGRYWKARTKYETAATGAGAGPAAAPAGPADEIDSWDRLSRGDDPT